LIQVRDQQAFNARIHIGDDIEISFFFLDVGPTGTNDEIHVQDTKEE
jgi:hypothetical protein